MAADDALGAKRALVLFTPEQAQRAATGWARVLPALLHEQ